MIVTRLLARARIGLPAAVRRGFPRQDRLRRLAIVGAAVWLVGSALVRQPTNQGDANEYHLMGESLLRHLSPELRAGDVASLAARSRHQAPDVSTGAALSGYFEAADGKWYCYHFWGYSLTTLPARLLLRIPNADLKAAQLTNALLLVFALHQVLFAATLARPAAVGLFAMMLFSPAVWFVMWSHPEAYSFSLVMVALVWAGSGRPLPAILAAAVAAAQNPPLVVLVAAIWGRTAFSTSAARLRGIALATLAALPAALPPLFYLWKFGTLSLIARESVDIANLSLRKAAELLIDLNLGLWPYMPLTVPLFALGLVARRWALGEWACAALFALAAFACTATGNWNHGTSGPSRYAVWLSPFVLCGVALAHASALGGQPAWRRRLWNSLVASAVLLQFTVVAGRGGLVQKSDALSHSWAARAILHYAPAWYSPSPEVFVSRTMGFFVTRADSPAVYKDSRGCRKAWVRPKDAKWLHERCGSLPAAYASFFERSTHRRAWLYVDWQEV